LPIACDREDIDPNPDDETWPQGRLRRGARRCGLPRVAIVATLEGCVVASGYRVQFSVALCGAGITPRSVDVDAESDNRGADAIEDRCEHAEQRIDAIPATAVQASQAHPFVRARVCRDIDSCIVDRRPPTAPP